MKDRYVTLKAVQLLMERLKPVVNNDILMLLDSAFDAVYVRSIKEAEKNLDEEVRERIERINEEVKYLRDGYTRKAEPKKKMPTSIPGDREKKAQELKKWLLTVHRVTQVDIRRRKTAGGGLKYSFTIFHHEIIDNSQNRILIREAIKKDYFPKACISSATRDRFTIQEY